MKIAISLIALMLILGCGGKKTLDEPIQDEIGFAEALQEPEPAPEPPPPPEPDPVAEKPAPVYEQILFDFDSDVLRPQSQTLLTQLCNEVNSAGGEADIKLVGGACTIGPEEYNAFLSQRRALAAGNYMGQLTGGAHYEIKSTGEDNCAIKGTEELWKCRAVDITITY